MPSLTYSELKIVACFLLGVGCFVLLGKMFYPESNGTAKEIIEAIGSEESAVDRVANSAGLGDVLLEDKDMPLVKSTLSQLFATRNGSLVQLEMVLNAVNHTDTELNFSAPYVRLVDDEEEAISPYLLPFQKPPVVSPGLESEIRLLYLLNENDLAGKLVLWIGDDELLLKDENAFDLEVLSHEVETELNFPNWSTR